VVIASKAGGSGALISVMEGAAVSDTPIYDQLRLELSSGRGRQERLTSTQDVDVPRVSRRRGESSDEPVVPAARFESRARRSVSVWSLVNRDK
jgi:hypothetical protein